MRLAQQHSVAGNFNQYRFRAESMDVLFHQQDGRFYIQSEDSDGQRSDFEVKYTLGFTPLQQYLIELPGGRLQAFTLAWGTRPAEEGAALVQPLPRLPTKARG